MYICIYYIYIYIYIYININICVCVYVRIILYIFTKLITIDNQPILPSNLLLCQMFWFKQ